MIPKDELIEIGTLYKPHGIKGEISAGLIYEIFPEELRCVIIEIDGIPVPFFIESWRGKSSERVLMKLEGIDDEKTALALSNQSIFALKSDIVFEEDSDDEGFYLYDLIGFNLYTAKTLIGRIDFIDDSTENILINIKTSDGKTVFIPFVDDWIQEYDSDNKKLVMEIPDGIIDLNK